MNNYKLKRFETMLILAVITNQLRLKYGIDGANAMVEIAKGNENFIASLLAISGLMPESNVFAKSTVMSDGNTVMAEHFDLTKGTVLARASDQRLYEVELEEWVRCSIGEEPIDIKHISYDSRKFIQERMKNQEKTNLTDGYELDPPNFNKNKPKDELKTKIKAVDGKEIERILAEKPAIRDISKVEECINRGKDPKEQPYM